MSTTSTIVSPPFTLPRNAVTGLILAGGRGVRMGSVDKGLQLFRGQMLVQTILQKLAPQVGTIVINANRHIVQYESLGVPVVTYQLDGFIGPLAGLQAGLQACSTPYLLTVPCDCPFLPDDLVARLAAGLLEQDADLAFAVTLEAGSGIARKQNQPVFCLLKTTLLPQLNTYLQSGGRRMDGWHGSVKVAECQFDHNMAFCNINTLEQLHHFESLADRDAVSPTTDP
ncbi:MAG: molybdenum cofactor guanylyltransferase MobA [Pseudomonadota bacterium]